MTKHRSDQVCGDTKYDPLTPRLRDGLLCKPDLATVPLLLDLVPVRTLARILQPSRFFRVLMERRRLKRALYERPVACLVQTRSSIMGQLGSIFQTDSISIPFSSKKKKVSKQVSHFSNVKKNFLKGSRADSSATM